LLCFVNLVCFVAVFKSESKQLELELDAKPPGGPGGPTHAPPPTHTLRKDSNFNFGAKIRIYGAKIHIHGDKIQICRAKTQMCGAKF